MIGEGSRKGQSILVAEGGKGGRGNMAFASNRNKAPDFAEQGDLGQTFFSKSRTSSTCRCWFIRLPERR